MRAPDALIDTCCLLNLCAVGDPELVLPHFPMKWHIARAAAAEEISIKPTADAERMHRRRVDLQPCFAAGVLTICEPCDNAEKSLYVQLAQEVDDGEAMSLAIAAIRGWAISTDDLVARRVARRLNIVALATPELLKLWAENSKATRGSIRAAISNIEKLARYVPRQDMPEYQWWRDHRIL